MRCTVGGEAYDLSPDEVIAAVKDMVAEPIRKHVVEIEGRSFPPKQVFAAVTGRTRHSFTTMEAQRVLRRLGFICRRATHVHGAAPAWVATDGDSEHSPSADNRIAAIEAAVGTMQAAIAGLQARVSDLEAAS
jgi:hypothetical protein